MRDLGIYFLSTQDDERRKEFVYQLLRLPQRWLAADRPLAEWGAAQCWARVC